MSIISESFASLRCLHILIDEGTPGVTFAFQEAGSWLRLGIAYCSPSEKKFDFDKGEEEAVRTFLAHQLSVPKIKGEESFFDRTLLTVLLACHEHVMCRDGGASEMDGRGSKKDIQRRLVEHAYPLWFEDYKHRFQALLSMATYDPDLYHRLSR
jgi:hypothetical protein